MVIAEAEVPTRKRPTGPTEYVDPEDGTTVPLYDEYGRPRLVGVDEGRKILAWAGRTSPDPEPGEPDRGELVSYTDEQGVVHETRLLHPSRVRAIATTWDVSRPDGHGVIKSQRLDPKRPRSPLQIDALSLIEFAQRDRLAGRPRVPGSKRWKEQERREARARAREQEDRASA